MQTVPFLRKELKSRSNDFGRCLVGLLLVAVFWLAWDGPQARAKTLSQTGSDENCLMCHADPDFVGSFQNDELISLYVDSSKYEDSIHGPAGLNCVACHTNLVSYPHHDDQQICTACHPEEGRDKAETEYTPLRAQLHMPIAGRWFWPSTSPVVPATRTSLRWQLIALTSGFSKVEIATLRCVSIVMAVMKSSH